MIGKHIIPKFIDNEEVILRSLYSPFHYDSKKKKIKPSAVQPPLNKQPDDLDPTKANNKVSTIRKNYASMNFCLSHAHRLENPSNNKIFEGYLKLIVNDVREAGADVQALPVEGNAAHANIVYTIVDAPLEDDIDELTKAELKEIQTKIANSGEFISKDIEQDKKYLSLDALQFPPSGCCVFESDTNPTIQNIKDIK